jgi:hypothetical protein
MRGADFLLCIAQVGLTFAGFAGLIGVFRPSEGKWIPQEVAGLSFILHHTLAAVVLSLLPFPLLALEYSETRVWTVSGSLVGLFLLAETSWQWHEVTRLTRAGYPPRRPKALYLTFFVSFLLTASTLYSVCYGGVEAVYKLGLLWLLVASGIQFLYFVSFFAQITEADIGRPVNAEHAQQVAPPDAPKSGAPVS